MWLTDWRAGLEGQRFPRGAQRLQAEGGRRQLAGRRQLDAEVHHSGAANKNNKRCTAYFSTCITRHQASTLEPLHGSRVYFKGGILHLLFHLAKPSGAKNEACNVVFKYLCQVP